MRPAPPLRLRNYLGQPVNIDSYKGKAVLVTFLYTNCPDVCPLIASNLRVAQNLMGAKTASKAQIIAVSVDPGGDTPKAVAAFLARHGMTGRMQYLIGSAHELASVWKAWGVGSERDAQQPSSSTTRASSTASPARGKRLDLLRGQLPARRNSPRRATPGRALSLLRWGGVGERSAGRSRYVVALVLLAVFGLASDRSAVGGRPAPALPREHIGGPPVTLASLGSRAGGRPSLVVFWASWCGPCARGARARALRREPCWARAHRGRRLERRALRCALVHPPLLMDLPQPA